MLFLILSLTPCVISVWLPGSPFDPSVLVSHNYEDNINENCTAAMEAGGELVVRGHDYTSVGFLLGGIVAAK